MHRNSADVRSLFGAGRLRDLRIYAGLLGGELAAAMYDPAPRYDLYWQPRRSWFAGTAAAVSLLSRKRVLDHLLVR